MRSDRMLHRTPLGCAFMIAPTVAASQRGALEHLLYFNVNQERVRLGIQKAIDNYGVPEIVERDGTMSVRVGATPGVECLFAISEFGHPLGIVIFTSLPSGRLVILHVGVLPRLRSTSAVDAEVLLELIHEVHRVARNRQGVGRVEVIYSQRPGPGVSTQRSSPAS